MRQALQSAGYQVLVANDGQEGLQLMKQESPQCLVLDIVLPGMSGFELCRYIRAQDAWRTLPIIMVSTKNSSSDRFWAMRQGASQYLCKPFKKEELIKTVMDVLLEQVSDATFPLRPSRNAPVPPRPIGRTFTTIPVENSESINPSHGMTGPRSTLNTGNSGPIPSTNWTGNNGGNAQFPPLNTFQDRNIPTGPRNTQFSSTNTAPSSSNGLPTRPHVNNQPRPFVEASQSHPVGQQSLHALAKFIPRRIDAPELLWSNSPEVLAISDRRARQLYMAIDSQKNVESLMAITQMNRDEIIASLRLLLLQHSIHLYEPNGRLFDSTLFESLLI
jgi:twitching motility two-component system response regulator PilH